MRGARHVSSSDVKELLRGLDWQGQRDDALLRRLSEVYIRRGYLFVEVSVERVPADSTIVVTIDEGEPARVGAVRITGVERFDKAGVAGTLRLHEGDVFRAPDVAHW